MPKDHLDVQDAASAGCPLKTRYDNFIGGKFKAPNAGRYFENISPITGGPIGEIARSDASDIEDALDAAHAAADAWGKTSVTNRANMLMKIAQVMEENIDVLALAETWDNGKPIRETTLADMALGIDHFRYFGSVIRAQEGSMGELDNDTVAYHFHEPLGVVGQIIPWNFPMLMAVWKLAPALAAGNCVVIKPAEQTPATIMMWAEMIADILPAGVLNIVNGFGLEAGKPLASSSRIAKIAFTGETTTGRLIAQYASESDHSRHAGTRRKVSEHLFLGRDAGGRRLFRQVSRGLHDVRSQSGRGLHLPVSRPDPGGHLRSLHGTRPRAGERHRLR